MSMSLAQFAQQQRLAQGLTVKEFARKAGLGISHAYQILGGERPRPSAETFDAVARGLSMTPAEMAVAMGRAAAGQDPDELETIAIYRQIDAEKRSAAKDMLRGLAVQPIRPPRTSKRQQPSDNRLRRPAAEIEHDHPHGGEIDSDDGLATYYAPVFGRRSTDRYLLATA